MAEKCAVANKARRQVEEIVKVNTVKCDDKIDQQRGNNAGFQEDRSHKRSYTTVDGQLKDDDTTPCAAKKLRPGPKTMRKPLQRIEHELWHSRVIKLWASGDVYFWIPSEETRLGIRIGAKLGCKLKANISDTGNQKNYTIDFAPDSIRIKYGDATIWHKSFTGLASLGAGKRLLEQLDRELKAQGLILKTSSESPKD
jgi:hypothetical protein